MQALFADVRRRPTSNSRLSPDIYSIVWKGVCSYLQRSLLVGKGVSLQHFGMWTFLVQSMDLGNVKKTLKTPAFVLGERFSRANGVKYKRPPFSGSVPVTVLNAQIIASLCSLSREDVNDVLKDIFDHVSECARACKPVRLDFHGVGLFTCSGGVAAFKFLPELDRTFEFVGQSPRFPLDSTVSLHTVAPSRPTTAPRLATPLANDASPPIAVEQTRPQTAVAPQGTCPRLFVSHAVVPRTTAPVQVTSQARPHDEFCQCAPCQLRAYYNKQLQQKIDREKAEKEKDLVFLERENDLIRQYAEKEKAERLKRFHDRRVIEQENVSLLEKTMKV